jgi:hypothetical protein
MDLVCTGIVEKRDWMNIKTGKRIITLLICLSLLADVGEGAVHKILFIGDSITKGKECIPGFRDDVYWKLRDMGFPFEYVGSVNESPPYKGFYFTSATTPEFYEKNGSHQIAPEMDLWKPTIAVIHLGTNDFWLNTWIEGGPYSADGGLTFTEHVSGNLARFVAYLSQWHDGRRGSHLQTIFLCQIIPKTWQNMGPTGIPMLNQNLLQMVEDIEAGRVPSIPPGLVRLVDQFSTFTGDMFSDDNHPNCSGYRHMTSIFIDAFQTLPLYLKPGENHQTPVLPGECLPAPVVFQITDGKGNPVPGVSVDFDISLGDASILSSQPVSDSLGQVQVEMQLGWSDSSVIQAYSSGLIDSVATQTIYPRDHVYIAGTVKYSGNSQTAGIVNIRWIEKNQFTAADQAGSFIFNDVPLHETVTLEAQAPDTAYSVIDPTVFQAALIARHVVGSACFSPIQQKAADIDGDTVVTIQDAITIARLVVGLEDLNNTEIGQWQFLPERLTCDSLITDIDTLAFQAIRVGDFGILTPDENETGCGVEIATRFYKGTGSGQMCVPVCIHGQGILATHFTALWDTSVAVLDHVEAMNEDFFVVSRELSRGIRIAAFSGQVQNNVDLVNLFFTSRSADSDIAFEIEDAVVNSIPVQVTTIVGDPEGENINFKLNGNFPNPFNGQTRIPVSISNGHVSLSIFNLRGQKIRTLVNEWYRTGLYEFIWDGRDEKGSELPSGIYLIRLENGSQTRTQRMELLR